MQMWLQILFRSIALFVLVVAFARFWGKRNITRVPPYKFISYIVLGIITALFSVGIINTVFGLITLSVWFILPLVIDYLSLKSKWFHDFINGKETVLIKHGKIMEDALVKARLTGEELLRELRSKNAFNLADVEFAVMEVTGDINIYLKSDKKPVTAYDLGIKTSPMAEPQTVILDGNIMNEPLASLGLNRDWLLNQLVNSGVALENVFIGQVDSSGELYLDLFDDAVELPQPKVKELVYANMEKAHASLSAFALETENSSAKAMYEENAQKLKKLMDNLNPYLLK